MDESLLADYCAFLLGIHNFAVESLSRNGNFNRRLFVLSLLEILHIMGIFDGLFKSLNGVLISRTS